MSPEEKAIRALHEIWTEAVNRADLVLLLTLIADDMMMLNPGEPPIGREGFIAKFTGAHERLKLHCASELAEVLVSGDLASTRSRDTLIVTPRIGGATVRLVGDRMTVYRRQADGRWLLARDIHNLTPVQ